MAMAHNSWEILFLPCQFSAADPARLGFPHYALYPNYENFISGRCPYVNVTNCTILLQYALNPVCRDLVAWEHAVTWIGLFFDRSRFDPVDDLSQFFRSELPEVWELAALLLYQQAAIRITRQDGGAALAAFQNRRIGGQVETH